MACLFVVRHCQCLCITLQKCSIIIIYVHIKVIRNKYGVVVRYRLSLNSLACLFMTITGARKVHRVAVGSAVAVTVSEPAVQS